MKRFLTGLLFFAAAFALTFLALTLLLSAPHLSAILLPGFGLRLHEHILLKCVLSGIVGAVVAADAVIMQSEQRR